MKYLLVQFIFHLFIWIGFNNEIVGITVYSPLKHWNVKPGQKIGVIGTFL